MGDPPCVAGELAGAPRLVPIADIDEDPGQPRQEFDAQALAELAATIAVRGVRQPISVRPHPDQPGRWMLNFGARRLRASRLAGKVEIPAFVDTAFDSYDQVIENEQREALRPLELALFVQRRLAVGDSQAEIARCLGKSRSYLTFVSALIDAPDWLLDLYRSGRCTGITELYELRKLHAMDGPAVEQWSREQKSVSRDDVHGLKQALGADRIKPDPRRSRASLDMPAADASAGPAAQAPVAPALVAPSPAQVSSHSSRTSDGVLLWARYRGAEVTIDLHSIPGEEGLVYVRQAASGERMCANAIDLQLVRVTAART